MKRLILILTITLSACATPDHRVLWDEIGEPDYSQKFDWGIAEVRYE